MGKDPRTARFRQDLDMQPGEAPFMGKIVISQAKGFSCAIDKGGTGEIYPHSILGLVFRQYFIYGNSDQFSGFVLKPEFHWCNFSICVSTGNHLHRNINTQNTFQGVHPFPNEIMTSVTVLS